ncbi:hypothetical protein A11A3_15789 [Alcanivorax hongdengensis A-11-3]|uniref:DUF2505 domain-containing protein n=1 Tax=Alcanivorax hongdengensis A-11-3 TaxID=1177179 RepID=L0WAB4_9GAMM|nr:DUF2505 domain-containing protein [Alcanivorax hongdengensis]EKF73027.1 hypothetical protein A11A3_15789 [Alcanivorax hongdengensis A-11-3]
MDFTEQNRYPFPADVVLQVFGDQDYFLQKYQLSGASNIQLIDADNQGDRSRITVSRDVDVDIDVPGFARKFVPETITLVQTDSWDRTSRTGNIDIQFKGMPAQVRGKMAVRDSDDGCVLDITFSVKINVPIVGDKLARVMAEDLKEKFQRDSSQAQKVMADIAQRYQ